MIAVNFDGCSKRLFGFEFGLHAYQFQSVLGDWIRVCRGVCAHCAGSSRLVAGKSGSNPSREGWEGGGILGPVGSCLSPGYRVGIRSKGGCAPISDLSGCSLSETRTAAENKL